MPSQKLRENQHERGIGVMSTNAEIKNTLPRFESILQLNVPKGREGKHRKIVMELMSDIEHLEAGSALKVPLSALPDTKENIRSALNRATRQKGIEVATSSDAEFLYIWKSELDSE
jgi:hypothetical protein